MEPPIQYCTTSDGVRIAVSITGDGPPLVLVPNYPFGGLQPGSPLYPEALRSLASSFTLVEYDPRGCGFSGRAIRDFSLDCMVRDIEAVVAHAGLRASAFCALADGVPVVIAYAAAWPEQVSHLILVDGWCQASDLARTASWRLAMATHEQDWTLHTETTARVLLGFQDEASAQRLAEYVRSCVEPDAMRAMNAAFDGWDVSGLLSSVLAPTLVVQNRNHPSQDTEAGRSLAAGIPGARLIEPDDPLPLARERLPALIRAFLQVEEPQPQTVAATMGEPVAPGAVQTILFTDVEGSTALTDRLGDAAAREVLREHERITREALRAHGGSEVKTMGDGFMASFGSATKALECAVAIQKAFDPDAVGAGLKPARPGMGDGDAAAIRVRIGLNAGEPIAEDDPDGRSDLFGTAVIVAARIAAQAPGGEILVSDVVRQLVAGKGFVFEDRGEHLLKGFEDPVRVWEVRWSD